MSGKSLPQPQVHPITPITDQPRPQLLSAFHKGITVSDKNANNAVPDKLRGLSSLSISNFIIIEIQTKPYSCDWDAHYAVKNSNKTPIFTAIEKLHCCYFGNLQNILIMDLSKAVIARVCFKDKSCVSGDMAIGVYSPPGVLLAAVVEVSTCFSNTSYFKISDSEGQKLFQVEYDEGLFRQLCGCPANFKITSEETQSEIAEIVEKTNKRLSLHFKGKLSVTSKLILTGFCLGLAHKAYRQKPTGNGASDGSASTDHQHIDVDAT